MEVTNIIPACGKRARLFEPRRMVESVRVYLNLPVEFYSQQTRKEPPVSQALRLSQLRIEDAVQGGTERGEGQGRWCDPAMPQTCLPAQVSQVLVHKEHLPPNKERWDRLRAVQAVRLKNRPKGGFLFPDGH